jgi:hypothetical protein
MGLTPSLCLDRLTEFIVCVPFNKTVTAPKLAQLFIDNVFKRFGMSGDMLSDRDPRFTTDFWRSLMELPGTTLSMYTACRPQSHGQTERANRTVEDMLRGFVGPKQRDWSRNLGMAEFA